MKLNTVTEVATCANGWDGNGGGMQQTVGVVKYVLESPLHQKSAA